MLLILGLQHLHLLQLNRSGATGDVYVEWGDGTTTTISTNTSTTTYKNYTVGSGTACSLGYTTFKCRIYADPTVTGITKAQFIGSTRTADSRNVFPNYSSGVLEIYLGDTLTTFTTYNAYALSWTTTQGTSVGNLQQLQYFKFPATVTASDFTSCFGECYSLRQVVMPTSAANMSILTSMFSNCRNLTDPVIFPTNATAITTLAATFSSCYSLTTVVFPPTLNSCTTLDSTFFQCYWLTSVTMPTTMNVCTTMNQTFIQCWALARITLPSLPACINYTNAFQSCKNMQAIVINSWNTNTGQTLTLSTMFQNCYSLANVQLPATCASGTLAVINLMFDNCICLLSVNLSAFSGSTAVGRLQSTLQSTDAIIWFL